MKINKIQKLRRLEPPDLERCVAVANKDDIIQKDTRKHEHGPLYQAAVASAQLWITLPFRSPLSSWLIPHSAPRDPLKTQTRRCRFPSSPHASYTDLPAATWTHGTFPAPGLFTGCRSRLSAWLVPSPHSDLGSKPSAERSLFSPPPIPLLHCILLYFSRHLETVLN